MGAAGVWADQRLDGNLVLEEGSVLGSLRSLQTCSPPPVTPLDVVKVRLQSQRPSVASGECGTLGPAWGGAWVKQGSSRDRGPGAGGGGRS